MRDVVAGLALIAIMAMLMVAGRWLRVGQTLRLPVAAEIVGGWE